MHILSQAPGLSEGTHPRSCTSLREPRMNPHSGPLNSDNLDLPAVNLLSCPLHRAAQPLPPPSSAPHPPQGAVSSAFPISGSGMMGSASGQELRGGCSREGGEGASLGPGIESVFPESQAARSTEAWARDHGSGGVSFYGWRDRNSERREKGSIWS